MKKNIIFVLSILAIIILVSVLSFVFKKDNHLDITVATNGGVPYQWDYEIEDESIVKFVKQYEVKNDNSDQMVGAQILINFRFKGLKEGETKIKLKYINVTSNEAEIVNEYTVKVDKNNNLKIVSTSNEE